MSSSFDHQLIPRAIQDDDLPILYEYQSDLDTFRMSAFPARERDAQGKEQHCNDFLV